MKLKPGTRVEVILSGVFFKDMGLQRSRVGKRGTVVRKTRGWDMYDIDFDDARSSDKIPIRPCHLKVIENGGN